MPGNDVGTNDTREMSKTDRMNVLKEYDLIEKAGNEHRNKEDSIIR